MGRSKMEGDENDRQTPPPASADTEPKTTLIGQVKTLFNLYSDYLWNTLSSPSNFFSKSLPYHRTSKKRCLLPLPFSSSFLLDCSPDVTEASSRVYDVMEDMVAHIFVNLHHIQKNLQFWQSRAEGSSARKLYFIVLERGPGAFVRGAFELFREFVVEGEGASLQRISQSASTYISKRIVVLSALRSTLAMFLAQIYMELDRHGEEFVKNPQKALPLILDTINALFSDVEAAIGHLHAIRQTDSSVDGNYSFPLFFEKLPEVNREGSQWTTCEIRDAITVIYKNLEKLDSYLALIVSKHEKPRKINQYWIRYTFGAVGISVCSLWVLRHSRLMGSSDIDNWIREAKESTVSFFRDHVEQPLLSIRDELFETFRKRHKGVMDVEEVQLTANSLHRMLLAFSEQTKGQKLPENASDQEMLEIVMARYEKELMHPIQNLLSGELAHALLIQVQKLKLDIETAMLELDQILKANEINFAVLAALPAFFLSLLLLMVVRAWFRRDTRAEGRGRLARRQRRLLLAEVEKQIMQYQIFIDQGQEKESLCMYGLVLYSLSRLFHAVERHAKETGEWPCLRQDIVYLAKPGLQTQYKFTVTSRMERLYECLLPSSKRQ